MKFFQEFKEFAIKGNMLDMAVGIIIGAAFGKIVSSLVEDIIMPPLGYLIGKVNFEDLHYVIQEAQKDPDGQVVQPAIMLKYGELIQVCFDFIIVAMVLFIVIKFYNLMKRKAEDEAETTVPTPRDIELLAKINETLVRIEKDLKDS